MRVNPTDSLVPCNGKTHKQTTTTATAPSHLSPGRPWMQFLWSKWDMWSSEAYLKRMKPLNDTKSIPKTQGCNHPDHPGHAFGGVHKNMGRLIIHCWWYHVGLIFQGYVLFCHRSLQWVFCYRLGFKHVRCKPYVWPCRKSTEVQMGISPGRGGWSLMKISGSE